MWAQAIVERNIRDTKMWQKKYFMQWSFFQVSVICAVHRVLVCPKVHGPRSISCPGCCSWSWRESGMCKCYWQGKSPWLCQDSPANRPKNRFGNPWAHGQECADSDWAPRLGVPPRLGRNLENVGVNPLNRPDPTTWAHVRAELSLCLWEKSDGENWREQNLSEITATGDSHPAWGLSPGFWDTNTLTFGIYISPRFTTVNWITFVNLNTCVRSVTNRSHQFRIVNTLKK